MQAITGIYNSTAPTLADGQQAQVQVNSDGSLRVGGIGSAPILASIPYSAVSATMTKHSSTSYTSGKLIAQSATAGSCSAIVLAVARAVNTTGRIPRLRLKVDDVAASPGWLGATIRVHLFRNNPTFTNADGGDFAGGISESLWLGKCDVLMDTQFSDYIKGNGVPYNGNYFSFEPASGTQNIYAVLESRSAVTVTASKVFTLTAETEQN